MDRVTLGINVDHVATLRQSRGTRYPDPVAAAVLAELGGADQITIHLREFKPDMVTLVPEKREELTTEGGLDVALNRDSVKEHVRFLQDGDIKVSLFVDPDIDQIRAAHKVSADAVELHTGAYCDARSRPVRQTELARLVDAAKTCSKIGLQVYAGHGLNLQNVAAVAAIREINEFNIGHSIVGHAVFVGMVQAVREMKAAILEARR
jgi:pyridoxine 5-phosphate synthase